MYLCTSVHLLCMHAFSKVALIHLFYYLVFDYLGIDVYLMFLSRL